MTSDFTRNRRRRHRARHLGHAGPVDERHHRRGDRASCDAIVDKIAADAADQGRASSPPARTASPAAPTSRCWRRWRAVSRHGARPQGEEAAMRALRRTSRKLSLLYRKLETCGKPWVAAINGTCMGGGFELCARLPLSRRRRRSDKTRVGLPEVKVGLFPGAGGTQRVARLMPTADALQMLLKGDQTPLGRAKAMSLVHEVAPAGRDRSRRAKAWIKARPQGQGAVGRPKASSCPSGTVYSPAGMMIWPAGQRHLPPRDLRQLSGRERDPDVRVRGPAAAVRPGAARSSSAISPRSCARRKRRR